MGSLIMHIVASKIVKEKYNLSNKFMAGCIMPDIYAKCGIDRNKTHFIDYSDNNLPNIQNFIKKYEKQLNDEILLGYLAHLIEDSIWFSNFINKYARVVNVELKKIEFVKDNSIHTDKEFSEIIYKDYDYIDNYLCDKYNISIEEYKYDVLKYFKDSNVKEKVNEYVYLRNFDRNRENFFLTRRDADDFIVSSSNEVENVIKKYLKNLKRMNYMVVY